ncbi:MAG: hypothetical protein JKX70_06285 [Phycisphaerales bacterium]|nr:hypothetical protein [Phycisphaerales bacterium]
MARKKPWCERAESRQAEETVKEKDVWKHSSRMFWGGLLQIMSITSYSSVWIAVGVLYFNPQYPEDDPYAPGFWEPAWPIIATATGLCIALFLISLAFTLPGKAKMKRALIPIRCQRCPKCFYDLSARPRDDDTCPECGLNAPRRECVRLWCKLLRSRF